MIKINNNQYKCRSFIYQKISGVEHLHIEIEGFLLCNQNKLHINYGKYNYFGCKILPRVKDGISEFLVYIYQKGDSELG